MTDLTTIASRALPLIDLTNLNNDCTPNDIDALCARAQTPFGKTAAVCVWPRFVAQCVKLLDGTGVKVATVVNFPDGDSDVRTVMRETKQVIADGAHEVDLVLPYKAFGKGDKAHVQAMLNTIRATTEGSALLKVIIEAGELKTETLIATASRICLEHGADFIKTSTGKVAVNATLENAAIMLGELKAFGDKSRGFKPAGGIRTCAEAGAFLALADDIMGANWASPATFRFGASGLLDDVLAHLSGGEKSTPTDPASY